jgi:streptomycin 6-kinase
MTLIIPPRLAASCATDADSAAWLARLPATVAELANRWSLTVADPFVAAEGSCAWVARAETARGIHVVLKIGIPHFEARDEASGLRFWNGDPTVRLLDVDAASGAMLLERCEPGTSVRTEPEPEQDRVVAGLLRRLWRSPAVPHTFRPLSAQLDLWSRESEAHQHEWNDPGLVREGLGLFHQLSRDRPSSVLLATDLHPGNVLRATRKPWLVIDPKPFVGDPAYDATQLFLSDRLEQLAADPAGVVERFADLIEIESARIRLWLFARLVADPRPDWSDPAPFALARKLAT